jgi:predicted permease
MESVLQDLRYALRVLARAPAFTAVTVLTIGIGTGANASVFGLVSALLMRPASGVVDPSSLVSIFTSDFSSGPYGESSYPDYLSLKSETTVFTAMAAEQDDPTGVVRARDIVERVRISSVTGEYFQVLGVDARAGRLIGPGDTAAHAAPVAVLGHAFWRRALAADPAVLGSSLTLNGHTYTVIGIASELFAGLDLEGATELWIPLRPSTGAADDRDNRFLSIIARLRPGSSLAEARTQVSAIAARLAEAYPETNRGTLGAPEAPRPIAVLKHTRLPPEYRSMVTTLGAILLTAVGLVMLIACANIGSLLIARVTVRDREMAVRFALGAAPSRVIRLILTESLLLGLAGGAVGLLCSLWTADLLPAFFPPEQAQLLDTAVDSASIVFIVALSIASALLFGLAPAIHAARLARSETLRSGLSGVSSVVTRTRMRSVLVSLQVTLAVILLIGAVLLTQSVVKGQNADPGFATREAVLASVELPQAEFSPQQGLLYYQSALERVRQLRGVQAASFVRTLPTSQHARRGFRMDGYVPQPGEYIELNFNIVSPGYFETLQIPVIAGRTFEDIDRPGGRPVVVVNELLADRYFDGRPIGKRLTDSSGVVLEIVGVVGNTVDLTVQSPPVPVVYYPVAQSYASRMTLIAATAGEPLTLSEAVRSELTSVNRNVPVFRITSLSAHMSEASVDSRLAAALVGACGAMALLLAIVGVYGVIAYAVARRQREIGLRLALGARPWHIVQLVLGEGLTVIASGIILGLGGAALSTRALDSMLYGVTASDPLTYVIVPTMLALVAAIAACAPARRALSVEPNTVLREE